jgi:hypothetical protein
MPLRQPPAEQPFSASLRNWNPVRNDWVLLHLGSNILVSLAAVHFYVEASRRSFNKLEIRTDCVQSTCDVNCHFDGAVFCRFDSFLPDLWASKDRNSRS